MREEFIGHVVKRWWNPQDSSGASTDGGSDDQQLCYHTLSRLLDDFLVEKRSKHRNPRVELLTHPGPAAQDLLEQSEPDKQMLQLDLLRNELVEAKLPPKPATAATALVGGNCARLDSNPQAAQRVWDWADNLSGEGWSVSDIPVLSVIKEFAKTRSSSEEWPTHRSLDAVANKSLDELKRQSIPPKEADDLHRRVLAHLTEAVSALPNEILLTGESDLRKWVEKNYRKYFDDSPFAPFHQHYARILLRLGDLVGAGTQVDMALAHSQPHMLQSIEASRQLRLAIDLEDLSREDITIDVTTKVEASLTKKKDEIQEELEGAIEDKVQDERAETAREIQNALMRIVEILGVFLAVVGVAVTAVGGIAVEGSIAVRIAVWGFGYGSIVSLFWLLRRIAGGPGLRAGSQGSTEGSNESRNGGFFRRIRRKRG